MKFDSASLIEEILWTARIADLPRGEDRAVMQRLYNGEPPFSPEKAQQNSIEINRNDLTGPNLISQARRQWNQGFLKPGNFFSVSLDSGPVHKRNEWSNIITRNINRILKRNRSMTEQVRATGANVMMYGIGPTIWTDRQSPIPKPIPVSSLLVASETDIDFDNLEWTAMFQEWTPTQLWEMTHGLKVDPGWNMPMVENQLHYIKEQQFKEPNTTAYQYMPERIEELIKQDKGFWGSDAVPTIDVWDFRFREAEDGKGWYRRVLLDWGLASSQLSKFSSNGNRPESRNKLNGKYGFLYSSEKRKYASNLSEMLHCQFGDCSAVAPFKYHSVRSLGWMLWGVCDLQNRLYCKFTESVFEQLMWMFRVASNADFIRLKKADFFHMGVIPQGINFITAQDRFKPDANLVEMAFQKNRQLMDASAASFTQDFSRQEKGSQRTATEVMAVVNSVNALVSGMMNLAYTYEEFKYREIARRFCMKNSRDTMVQEFRKLCLKEGVPAEMLDSDRWEINAERAIGAGNKTLEMAQAQGLQQIRQNLSPDAQRRADHIMVEALTDDPALAEEMAPLGEIKPISNSTHDAELATERLMRGLAYQAPKDAVYEDYVMVWMKDLTGLVQQANARGGMATQEQIVGMTNIGSHISQFLEVMDKNEDEKAKVKQYQDALKSLMNFVRAFQQRLIQQARAGNGQPGVDPKTMAKVAEIQATGAEKRRTMQASHAARTAQRQTQFELEQQREDRRTAADIRRESAKAGMEMMQNRMKAFQE